MLNTENKERYEALFDKLVPSSGKCETLGGEILRAVSRIGYRWYNDGDKFLEGYGRETVNPAVRFLIHVIEKHDVTEWFKGQVDKLCERMPYSGNDDDYDSLVDGLTEAAVDCSEALELGSVPNEDGDMFDYADPVEDVDEDEEDCYEEELFADEYDEYDEDEEEEYDWN